MLYNLVRMVVRLKTTKFKKKSIKKRYPSEKLRHFENQRALTFPFQYQGKKLVAILGGGCWLEVRKKKISPTAWWKSKHAHTFGRRVGRSLGVPRYVPRLKTPIGGRHDGTGVGIGAAWALRGRWHRRCVGAGQALRGRCVGVGQALHGRCVGVC